MVSYWLMKSEPHVYSFEDLQNDGSTHWDGVRNYQARNFMRDDMKIGDLVLYYTPIQNHRMWLELQGFAKKDTRFTSFEQESKYFDEKSTAENPRWFMVDLEPVSLLKKLLVYKMSKITRFLRECY